MLCTSLMCCRNFPSLNLFECGKKELGRISLLKLIGMSLTASNIAPRHRNVLKIPWKGAENYI